MDMLRWKLDVIDNPVKKACPILSYPVTRLMGINVRQLISSSETMAEGMKILADRIPSLAAFCMMDLSVEIECFGASAEAFDDMVPFVSDTVVHSLEEAERIRVPEPGEGRTQIYLDAAAKAKKLITDRPVIAFASGPYTLACRMMGMEKLMAASFADPGIVFETLEKATEFICRYAEAFRQAGADGIVLAEPTAGLISPKMARTFSHPYTKAVVDRVRSGEFACFYHNCGESVLKMKEDLADLHMDGYNFGNCINIADMLDGMPEDSLVLGNVSPVEQFCDGTPDGIRRKTFEIMETCSKHRNFVISSGCDVPAAARWDCIDAFFDEVTRYYAGR